MNQKKNIMKDAVKMKKYDSMLFDYKTTALTDFKYDDVWEPPSKTEYKQKAKVRKTWPYPLREQQTMTDWKEGRPVPFDLFIRPKDIVRTDPRHVQEYFEPEPDYDLEKVRKTRPRLVMTPAVAVDDIDPTRLQVILKDTYLTSYQKAIREGLLEPPVLAPSDTEKPKEDGVDSPRMGRRPADATAGVGQGVKPYTRVEAPLTGTIAPSNPMSLPKYNPPPVPPEWRMDSVSWDNRQLRSYCDPTRDFWLNYSLKKCRPCDETAIVREHRLAKHLAKRQQ